MPTFPVSTLKVSMILICHNSVFIAKCTHKLDLQICARFGIVKRTVALTIKRCN